jgi:hypothetical protein
LLSSCQSLNYDILNYEDDHSSVDPESYLKNPNDFASQFSHSQQNLHNLNESQNDHEDILIPQGLELEDIAQELAI